MRHPINQPKYRINQKVHIPLCSEGGIIKGIRYVGNADDNNKFKTNGWEYNIYHWSTWNCVYICDRWSDWGWITESEIDKLN
ncbi:hypothetical protein ANSO36C_67690 (plasmid) [Nostoc cf. commune SO-36]|uniref:Uncharacterized protein n=1 Tax=Nostoc cf. commune SO-36 TaxID=449208 RepID=A0ABN6QCT8_NOSCO|nr:hypothetical protein [Nostoc commune]BDI20967.1 hypothetical protein ANSO36C_67690 [Nostoc cf. commune SO-36]